jgi:hypothetical protein
MNSRDKSLQSIRPILMLTEDKTDKKDLINFQNNTLRPILKFQNELLVLLFETYIKDRKFRWETSASPIRKQFVLKAISNDNHSKAKLLGCIIGLFTCDETMFYNLNQNEINRRIVTMCKERIVDQLVTKV